MGQAKRRGNRAERVLTAVGQGDMDMKKISELIAEFDLPKDSNFLGYIIHNRANDDYLGAVDESGGVTKRYYANSPELALRFDNFPQALDVCSHIGTKTRIGWLFETDDKFAVGFFD